jgi:enoyl-CoA hydratase/carnithine racemase
MTALLFGKDGHVATLTINRPETRNTLGEEGDGALFAEAAAAINAERDIRCVILTGSGPAFCSGANLAAVRARTGVFGGDAGAIRKGYKREFHAIVHALWNLEVPLLAAVNGAATGFGNDVACLADIRLAADTAGFAANFLKLGLVPGAGGAWLLPRLIGEARAAELFFTGETIDAATALHWGLVSRVVPAEMLLQEARGLAVKIAHQPPGVLRLTKKLMREGLTAGLDGVLDLSAAFQSVAHTSEDHAEALAACQEKRLPVFKDR